METSVAFGIFTKAVKLGWCIVQAAGCVGRCLGALCRW